MGLGSPYEAVLGAVVGEFADERGGTSEEGVEAVLDGLEAGGGSE